MAEAIGNFNMARTSFTMLETAPGELTHVQSFEGTADGFNQPFGSLSYTQPLAEGGANFGSCTWIAKTLLDDGKIIADIAHGTWNRIGNEPRAEIKLNNNLSDGRKLRCEAILDHEKGTLTGTIFLDA